MLTQKQKVAIRSHLGAPFAGTAQAGRLYGWRFTFYREDLEYRMNNMQVTEEYLITGASLGSYRIGGMPTVGDVLDFTVTVAGGGTYNASYTVQESDFSLPPNPVNPTDSSPLYIIALNAANKIAAQVGGIGFVCVGTMPADLFAPQFMPPYFAEIYVMGTPGSAFVLSCSVTGTTNLAVEDPGSPSPINATFVTQPTGVQQTVYGYVALLDYLRMGPAQQNLSLWLESASGAGGAGVKFRMSEFRARNNLYRHYAEELSRIIGGETYVQMFGQGSSAGGSA
jgi:hypothetical protein